MAFQTTSDKKKKKKHRNEMVESFLFCFFVWTIWIVDDILFWALRPHPVQDKIEEELLFCFFFFF